MRPTRVPKPRQLNQDEIDKSVSEGEAVAGMFQSRGWKIANKDLQSLKALLTNIRAINDEITLFKNKQALDILDQWENRLNERVRRAESYREKKLYKEEIPIQTR